MATKIVSPTRKPTRRRPRRPRIEIEVSRIVVPGELTCREISSKLLFVLHHVDDEMVDRIRQITDFLYDRVFEETVRPTVKSALKAV